MSATTKRTIWIIAAALLALFLWSAMGPSSNATVRAATPTAAPITHTATHHHHGLTTTITRTSGGLPPICPEHPNGVLAGWLTWHRSDGPWPLHLWQYTYGAGWWGGTFCSNDNGIWNVNWGGSPDGAANGALFWTWYPSDSKLAESDNTGDVRYRRWRSHFGVHITGVGRDEYPWLYARIMTGARVTIDDGCGC